MAPDTFRANYRRQFRDEAVRVAHRLAVSKGWENVRMGEIADRVGSSRALLYKEFGDKAGLGDAVVLREAERFLQGVRAVLDGYSTDAAAGLAASVTFTLEEAEKSPLLKAVLISHRDAADGTGRGVLPLLTTSFSILQVSTGTLVAWSSRFFPDIPQADMAEAADAMVRLTVSHLALPNADRARTSQQITEVGMRYLGLSPVRGTQTA